MKTFQVKYQGELLAKKVKKADSFFSRLKGLMFSKELPDCDALWISACRSIHTCFMNYPIDVVFLDGRNKIVKVIYNIRPWKMTRIYFSADSVIEFMGGTLRKNIKEQDNLEFVCLN